LSTQAPAPLPALTELQRAVEGIRERVGQAVVGLGRGWGLGSGVVAAPGQVLTNAHNLRERETTVTFADGRTAVGRVAGVDIDGDLAVLAVDTDGVEPVEWDPGATGATIGAPVFALANPGGRGLRVTLGLVSATDRSFRSHRGRRVRGSIEHTALLPRGSSGGPLVDGSARLLGLNTVRVDGGLILAIPADADLRERVRALAGGESRPRLRLGVALAPPHVARKLRRAVGLPERDGLLVRAVEAGSAADRAGIEKGDLIVAAGDAPTTELDHLHAALDALDPESTLTLTVVRGTEDRDVVATFGDTRSA